MELEIITSRWDIMCYLLDSDLTGEAIVAFVMQAFGTTHEQSSAEWNMLLCQHHGI